MLSVEGYKVEWGADTAKFEEASKKVRATAGHDASFFAREWETAGHKAKKTMFGFGNVAKAAIGGVGGAVAIGIKGVLAFSDANEEAGRSMKAMKDSFTDLFVSIGADISGAMGGLGSFVGLLKEGRDYFVDLFQGEGTAKELADALAGRRAQTDQNKARSDITGKAASARRARIMGHDVADEAGIQAAYQLRLTEALKAYNAEARSGDAVRIRAAAELYDIETAKAGETHQNELEAMQEFWNGVRAKQAALGKERQDRENDAREAAKKEQDDANARQKDLKDQNDRVSLAQKQAQIDLLAATGRDTEAQEAKIRLETEQQIAKVMDEQNVSLFARLAAADAISAAANAQILGLGTSKDKKQSLSASIMAGGIGAGRGLAAQVFGGPAASQDKQTTIAESQLAALKDIAKNTSQSTLGLIGP